jgi:hypothetical protein
MAAPLTRLPVALLAILLAGCGSADHSVAPTGTVAFVPSVSPRKASEEAQILAQDERAQSLAQSVFHRRIRSRYPGDRFLLVTEATSATPTHLLIQFVGALVAPRVTPKQYLEIKVLVAARPNEDVRLSMLRERTLRSLGRRETATKVPH